MLFRSKLFARLKAELDLHSRIEEAVFYPALQEKEMTRAVTLKAYQTHQIIKTLLNELVTLPVDSQEWTAKLATLGETVGAHIEEEENEQFKNARQVLTKKEIDELGKRMEAEKSGKPQESAQNASEVGTQGAEADRETGPPRPLPRASRVSAPQCSPCLAFAPSLLRRLCGQF